MARKNVHVVPKCSFWVLVSTMSSLIKHFSHYVDMLHVSVLHNCLMMILFSGSARR